MRSIILVTPVHRRFPLTQLMLRQRVATFTEAESKGIRCGCVVIGDDDNLGLAEELGFDIIEAPNVLGSKYNDGHEHAVNNGWDVSFQVNSDQVFDPELLVAIASSPPDKLIETSWLTAVHNSGKKALSYRNRVWSMKAYPRQLLEWNPRPCQEDLMQMCDSSVHNGVVIANPQPLAVHNIVIGPLETIQFESGYQLTPWRRNVFVAKDFGVGEHEVPWDGVVNLHGPEFTAQMKEFYGL